MAKLHELQRRLSSLILGDTPLEQGAAELLPWIEKPQRGDGVERIRLYVDGYRARLAEALESAFPAVRKVLGRSEFIRVLDRYRRRVRFASYNLDDAGAQFPDFVATDASSRELPFLADLGRLEWLVSRAFHADANAADLALLDRLDGALDGSMKLRFQPFVGVVSSSWPILGIWSVRDRSSQSIDVDLVGRAEAVLVRRDSINVVCERIGDREACALSTLIAGASLESLLERSPWGDDEISSWLARWFSLGLIAGASIERWCPHE